MDNKNKEKMQEQIEMHLHEQYAINNNEGVKSFITFLTAILALFGAFGYVFINTNYHISNGCRLMTCHGCAFEVYVAVALVTAIILAFLAEIALSLGLGQRRDHIIIQRIREKYYDKEDYKKVFKHSYKATDKTVCDFLPDIYNIFYWMIIVAQLIILVATIYQCCRVEWSNGIYWLPIVQFGILLFCLYRRCCHYYCKYQKI